MIFKDSKYMFEFLCDYYNNEYRHNESKEINIMTFGLYLGITYGKDYSEKKDIKSRKFINAIKDENHKIIVGLPPLIECKPDCYYCKKKHNDVIKRLNDTKDILGLNIKFCKESHAKLYQLGDLILVGGMNLSDSGWDDFVMVVENEDDKYSLNSYFHQQWNKLK